MIATTQLVVAAQSQALAEMRPSRLEHINVGTGKEITICELSELVVEAVWFHRNGRV